MNYMCSIYLNTPLLSVQEVHQWPQDIICILCNCVSGISSRICCPFHLTEDIRHLLDTLINPSLKAAQIGERQKPSLSVAETQGKKFQVHSVSHSPFTRLAALFLTVFVTKGHALQLLCPPPTHSRPPLNTRHEHIWDEFVHSSCSKKWSFPDFRKRCYSLLKAPCSTLCFLHHRDWDITQSNDTMHAHSENPGVHQQKSSYDPLQANSLK